MPKVRLACLVTIIVILLLIPSLALVPNFSFSSHLSPVSPSYSEHLFMYLTSAETLWRADLSGGNISAGSIQNPSSVPFTLTLTHYSTWNSRFELFTKYGLSLLGPFEPNPNGTILQVNTTSQTTAQSLANSLDQRFALAYQSYGTTAQGYYLFFSPIDFNTEMHVFFWNLVPSYYGGFASMLSEQQFESSDLAFYALSYSSNTYSISFGGLTALSSTTFDLYTQLGISQSPLNYSSSASSSTISVHVLGGQINSTYPWTNHLSNYSAAIYLSHSPTNSSSSSVPRINGTLDFSFPTIVAYRQISGVTPLTPTANSTDSVTITVSNIGPSGSPAASNVKLNDSWLYSYPGKLSLTVGNTSGSKSSLGPGQSFTVAYSFKILASSGTIDIPPVPVSYSFSSSNSSASGSSFTNGETLAIGAKNTPELEPLESVSSSSIQAGQALVVNINATNKGDGPAFNVKSQGQSLANLPAGQTWNLNASSTAASLLQANAKINYSVNWQDSNGTGHSATTNSLTTVYSFSNPSTPGVTLAKRIRVSSSYSSANVSLVISDSSNSQARNVTIADPLPVGVSFLKALNASSLREGAKSIVLGNVSSIKPNRNVTLEYVVNFTNPHQSLVFLPANASTLWNNVTLTHNSNGIGLALGVVGSKQISPNQGFQGSNVTVSLGLQNKGPLPIYDVNLSSTSDPFLNVLNSKGSYQTVLQPNSGLNATLNANLTGAPGVYNSSSGTATFIFAGSNQTAATSTFRVTIYGVIQGNMSYSGAKIEENHPITIRVLIYNPSNVTVSDVRYIVNLPPGLRVTSGSANLTSGLSLGAHQNITNNFVITTSQPYFYAINPGSLNFTYQGHVLKGATTGVSFTIVDDFKVRYLYPIIIAILIIIATAFFVHRLSRKKQS